MRYVASTIIASAALTTTIASIAFGAKEPSAALSIQVSNYDSTYDYDLDLAAGTSKLLPTTKRQRDSKDPDRLPALLRDLNAKKVRQTLATSQLAPSVRDGFKWALMSPNCQFAVAGRESAELGVLTDATVMNRATAAPIHTITLKDRDFIKDLGWSADSRYLVVVVSRERYGGNPIAAMAGHPTPYDTLSAVVVDVSVGVVKTIQIAKDITYASVLVLGESAKCASM